MKKVLKNYIYNLVYQILVMILPIITTPYISRVLKPEGVGDYNFAFSIVSVVLIVAQLGTNLYGQREIAFVQSDLFSRSKVFWEILIIRVITTFISLPIYLIIAFQYKKYSILLLWMSIYLIANIIEVSWFFQGLEDFKKTAIRSIGVKVIGALLIFLTIKSETDLNKYVFVLAMAQLLGNAALLIKVPEKIVLVKIKALELKKHIKPVLNLFLPTAAVYVYTYIDKIILGVLSSNEEVGYFSQAEKIVKLLMTILTSLGIVLLPHIATIVKTGEMKKINEEISEAIAFVFGLGFPMAIGSIIIGDRFIPWFLGADYIHSVILFKVLSPLIVIIGLASVVGQAILIPLKKQKVYSISILLGALLNLVCNFLLIPHLNSLGAAIGTIVAELTVTSIQSYAVYKCIGVNVLKILVQSYKYLVASLIMGIIMRLISIYSPVNTIMMFAIVLIGVFVYFFLLVLLKDKFITKLKIKGY